MRYRGYLVRTQSVEIEFDAEDDEAAEDWWDTNAIGNASGADVYTDSWQYDEGGYPEVVA